MRISKTGVAGAMIATGFGATVCTVLELKPAEHAQDSTGVEYFHSGFQGYLNMQPYHDNRKQAVAEYARSVLSGAAEVHGIKAMTSFILNEECRAAAIYHKEAKEAVDIAGFNFDTRSEGVVRAY